MKPMKITVENRAKIEETLLGVNGRAEQHAYTTLSEIQTLAEAAEAKLEKLGIPKGMRPKAQWLEVSGSSVANAYAKKASTRKATSVALIRKASGWFLIYASSVPIYKEGGGPGRLLLTQEQASEAIKVFSKQFKTI